MGNHCMREISCKYVEKKPPQRAQALPFKNFKDILTTLIPLLSPLSLLSPFRHSHFSSFSSLSSLSSLSFLLNLLLLLPLLRQPPRHQSTRTKPTLSQHVQPYFRVTLCIDVQIPNKMHPSLRDVEDVSSPAAIFIRSTSCALQLLLQREGHAHAAFRAQR